MTPAELTISHAQATQPWTIPYSMEVEHAHKVCLPHILESHAVLHAAKTVGKLAAVYEATDHNPDHLLNVDATDTIKAMAADLVTVALRLANLHGFDLASVLCQRVKEKNGFGYAEVE